MSLSDVILVVDRFFAIYMIMLFIRILSSWVPEFQDHPVMRFVAHYTDPYLGFFKRFIPPLGMIDLSPIVGFFSLKILEEITEKGIVPLIYNLFVS